MLSPAIFPAAPKGAVRPRRPTTRRTAQCVRRAAIGTASTTAATYGGRLGADVADRIDTLDTDSAKAHAVQIAIIVAVVIIAGIGALAYVAAYCISRGGSYDGGLSVSTNGWKVWEYRLSFRCTQ